MEPPRSAADVAGSCSASRRRRSPRVRSPSARRPLRHRRTARSATPAPPRSWPTATSSSSSPAARASAAARTSLAGRYGGSVKHTYRQRAPRLRGHDERGAGQAARRRPGGGLRRSATRSDGLSRHPDQPALVGPGPHRPAGPAAEQIVHLPGRQPRAVHAYVIDTGIRFTPQRLRWPGRPRPRLRRQRQRRHRLPRARHARRRHRRRHRVRRRQGRRSSSAVRVLNCSGSGTTAGIVAGDRLGDDQRRRSRPSRT